MKSLLRTFRQVSRSLHFFSMAATALGHYSLLHLTGRTNPVRRCLWMQRYAQGFSRVVHLRIRVQGAIPQDGLVVSNHLGYLDILALGSVIPGAFVAKKEVRSWPVLGALARCAGTVFVNREKNFGLPAEIAAMRERFLAGIPVILFAEGTSSGGHSVLPFRSSLFQGAMDASAATPAALAYELDEGSVSEEVCYWKDMTLLPHLWNLFGKKELRVTIRFGQGRKLQTDRKELAKSLQQAVVALRSPQLQTETAPG